MTTISTPVSGRFSAANLTERGGRREHSHQAQDLPRSHPEVGYAMHPLLGIGPKPADQVVAPDLLKFGSLDLIRLSPVAAWGRQCKGRQRSDAPLEPMLLNG